MSKHDEHPTNKLVTALELPQDLILGLPYMTCMGNREVTISNHRGILSYEPEEIQILVKNGQIRFTGKGLVITSYTKDEMMIRGFLHGMEYLA